MKCETCTYYDRHIDDIGTCCRYPPVPAKMPSAEFKGEIVGTWWPMLKKDEHCGEYISKPIVEKVEVK